MQGNEGMVRQWELARESEALARKNLEELCVAGCNLAGEVLDDGLTATFHRLVEQETPTGVIVLAGIAVEVGETAGELEIILPVSIFFTSKDSFHLRIAREINERMAKVIPVGGAVIVDDPPLNGEWSHPFLGQVMGWRGTEDGEHVYSVVDGEGDYFDIPGNYLAWQR